MKWLDKVKAFFNYEENVEAYCATLVGVFLFGAVMLGIWGAKWKEKNTKTVLKYYDFYAETVVYDKCEYAAFEIGESRYIVHKGNCNNPVHAGKTGKEDTEK